MKTEREILEAISVIVAMIDDLDSRGNHVERNIFIENFGPCVSVLAWQMGKDVRTNGGRYTFQEMIDESRAELLARARPIHEVTKDALPAMLKTWNTRWG